jgi:chromosome segregation ATPase
LQLQEQLVKESAKRKQAEEDLTRSKSDHAIALADMGQFKEEIASLKAKLDTQQEQSADLDQVHKAVVDLRLHVEQLEKENADLSATNARLRAQVDQRTATLALQKNHESESLKKELEEERLQVAKLREELETAESMLESKILRETELERALDSLRSLSSPEAPVTPTKGHRFAVDAAEHPGGYSVPEGDVGVYKSPQKIDPAAGRALWCGLCEKEGHESIDCPFSDEF